MPPPGAYATELAGAVDEGLRWIGGDLVIVQLGDQLDRGDSDRVVLLINFWHPELAEHERRIELDTWGYQPI